MSRFPLFKWFQLGWRSPIAASIAGVHVLVFLIVIFKEAPLPLPSEELCDPPPLNLTCAEVWELWGAYVAGRYFHHDIDFRALELADLPALFVAFGLDTLMRTVGIRFSMVAETYVFASFWLTLGTIQWWLVGALIAARRSNQRLQRTAGALSS